jgi:hypothetical protein
MPEFERVLGSQPCNAEASALPTEIQTGPRPPVARPKIRFPHSSVCNSVRSARSSGTGFHPRNEGI